MDTKTFKLLERNEISKRINSFGKVVLKADEESHFLACQTLHHAAKHGDVTLCQRLYETMGAGKGSMRGNSLKGWFAKMGPITARTDRTTKTQVWKLKDGWKPEDFKLTEALNTPWYEEMGSEVTRFLTLESILNSISPENIRKRIATAVEEGRFQGDADAAIKVVDNVINIDTLKSAKEAAHKAAIAATETVETESDKAVADSLKSKSRKAA